MISSLDIIYVRKKRQIPYLNSENYIFSAKNLQYCKITDIAIGNAKSFTLPENSTCTKHPSLNSLLLTAIT